MSTYFVPRLLSEVSRSARAPAASRDAVLVEMTMELRSRPLIASPTVISSGTITPSPALSTA